MARLGSTWFDGFIGSAKYTGQKLANRLGKVIPEMVSSFVSGWDGQGWRLFKADKDTESYTLEIDNLTVRGNMRVYELIIQKVRAICGSLGISQACGRVEAVEEDVSNYYLTMEGDEDHGYGGFMAGDYVRCQRWTEQGLRGYWVEVAEVNGAVLTIPKAEFNSSIGQQGKVFIADCVVDDLQRLTDGSLNVLTDEVQNELSDGLSISDTTEPMCAPVVGDELVQYGNSTNTARQCAVYIHADEDGHPAVDILQGISQKTFAGCLSVRLGGGLPTDEGYAGDDVGLYCKNGHIISVGGKDGATTIYEFKPSGDFSLGNGKIVYDVETDTLKLDASVEIEWTAPAPKAEVMYAITTSGTTYPNTSSSQWQSTIPTLEKGKYLWTRTHYTYTDGTDSGYSYSVTYIGTDGVGTDGEDAASYILIPDVGSITYDPNTNTYTPETANIVSAVKIVGTKQTSIIEQVLMSVTTEAVGYAAKKGTTFDPSQYTNPLRCEFTVKDGTATLAKVGIPIVTDGANGKELTKVVNHYAASSSKTTAPADTDFTDDFSKIDFSDEKPYIWNYETIHYSDGTTTTTDKRIISNWAADGRSIESIAEYYHADARATGVTLNNTTSADWTTDPTDDIAKMTDEKPYLWNYEVVTYDKANSGGATQSVGMPVVIGTKGKDGADGESVRKNLLNRTDLVFDESEYLGTVLDDGNDLSNYRNYTLLEGQGVGGSDMMVMEGTADAEVNAAQWDVTDELKGGCWYVLSFYVRGSGTMQTFVYPNTNTNQYNYSDGERNAASSDVNHTWTLTSEWVRHYHAFFVPASISGSKYVLFRIPQGAANTASVCLVRLEKKATLTAYGYYQLVRGYIADSDYSVVLDNATIEEGGGVDGTNCVMTQGAQQWPQTNIFYTKIQSVLMPDTIYTLSFYVKSDYAMETNIQSVLATDFTPLADGAETSGTTAGQHTWPSTSGEWVRHTYTFKTASEIPATVWLYFRRECASGSKDTYVRICQMKLERGAKATAWNVTDSDMTLKLPTWVKEWSGHSTKIGSTYVVTPQAFFGEKEDDGTLTGILMGNRAATIDGVTKTGLFALSKNDVRVAIDPVNKQYKFRGTIIADEGQFFGMTYGSVFKSSAEVTADNFWTYFQKRTIGTGDDAEEVVVPNYYQFPTIVVFKSVPSDIEEQGYVDFYLPPFYYGSSTPKITTEEDYALALSLLGTTFVVFDKMATTLIRMHGIFLKEGDAEPTLYRTSKLSTNVGGARYFTLRVTSNGKFVWEYMDFTEDDSVPFNGLQPMNPGGLQIGDPGSLTTASAEDETETE